MEKAESPPQSKTRSPEEPVAILSLTKTSKSTPELPEKEYIPGIDRSLGLHFQDIRNDK